MTKGFGRFRSYATILAGCYAQTWGESICLGPSGSAGARHRQAWLEGQKADRHGGPEYLRQLQAGRKNRKGSRPTMSEKSRLKAQKPARFVVLDMFESICRRALGDILHLREMGFGSSQFHSSLTTA